MAKKAKDQDAAPSMGGQEVPLAEAPEDEGVGSGDIVSVNHLFIAGGPDGTCRDCELAESAHPDLASSFDYPDPEPQPEAEE